MGIAAAVSGIASALACQGASAQSSVTLYGMTDLGIRYLTNADAQNDNKLFMANGAVINSHVGLRGTEDLGGGLKAVFQLESNVNPQDGTLSDSGRLFGSEAYVGLASRYGTLTFGRQNTPLFDKLVSTYDPLTYANYPENSWLPFALGAGLSADNSIKYDGQFGGLEVGAIYSFGSNYESNGADGFSGEVPGHLGAGSMFGFIASYVTGPVSVAAGVQQTSDNSNNKQTVYNADIAYAFSKAKIYLGYLHSQDNTGLVDTLLAEQPIADIGQLKKTDRIDDGPFAGAAWQVSGPLLLTCAFYYDHMRNAATADDAPGTGTRYTVVALAEYSLSKRTEVYGTVDFNRVSGAATVELPGRSNQTGVAIGLRNFF
ncbi:porin [Paraburkholderia phytofirmans]|uniref:Porin n=1 Tax=Paraburkholderia phytofirmans OLGA172 TaxID=1417228 RepID=A0A160FGJ6_9BURK|nr:porin [Paraburkholderia phytofirmans]ANB71202.1 porin [Paraburkholderia phytofirmans OLGA172]